MKTIKEMKTIAVLCMITATIILLCGMTSCSNDSDIIDNKPIEEPTVSQTYTVSIPATFEAEGTNRAVSFDGNTSNSTFVLGEKVYIFNITTKKFLGSVVFDPEKGETWDSYLTPTHISADGKTCDLTGTITGTLNEGDELMLLYNLNEVGDGMELERKCFSYGSQKGTAAKVVDGAIANVTLSSYSEGVFTTTATASFTNVQSMFRFKFNYDSTPLSVKKLMIHSKNYAIATMYMPLSQYRMYDPEEPTSPYSSGTFNLEPSSATSDYLYAALCFDESKSDGDLLTFTVIGSDNYVYRTTKSTPSGGFKNGKYYYNSSPIDMPCLTQYKAPNIKWNNPSSPVSPSSMFHYYDISTSNADIELSGEGYGYRFEFSKAATITLDNLTYWYDGNRFIQLWASLSDNLTFNIKGDNRITNLESGDCLYCGNALYLTGNGTLTVTCRNASHGGIFAWKNYTSVSTAASKLAASGSTVTRSARTDNPDGTYTWTYTVVTP